MTGSAVGAVRDWPESGRQNAPLSAARLAVGRAKVVDDVKVRVEHIAEEAAGGRGR